ncbi:Protein of unknown function, partial [Gryllus bimaculatus]
SRGGKTRRAGDRNRILASSNEITPSALRELLALGDSRDRSVRSRIKSPSGLHSPQYSLTSHLLYYQRRRVLVKISAAQPPCRYGREGAVPSCYGCLSLLPSVGPFDPAQGRRWLLWCGVAAGPRMRGQTRSMRPHTRLRHTSTPSRASRPSPAALENCAS